MFLFFKKCLLFFSSLFGTAGNVTNKNFELSSKITNLNNAFNNYIRQYHQIDDFKNSSLINEINSALVTISKIDFDNDYYEEQKQILNCGKKYQKLLSAVYDKKKYLENYYLKFELPIIIINIVLSLLMFGIFFYYIFIDKNVKKNKRLLFFHHYSLKSGILFFLSRELIEKHKQCLKKTIDCDENELVELFFLQFLILFFLLFNFFMNRFFDFNNYCFNMFMIKKKKSSLIYGYDGYYYVNETEASNFYFDYYHQNFLDDASVLYAIPTVFTNKHNLIYNCFNVAANVLTFIVNFILLFMRFFSIPLIYFCIIFGILIYKTYVMIDYFCLLQWQHPLFYIDHKNFKQFIKQLPIINSFYYQHFDKNIQKNTWEKILSSIIFFFILVLLTIIGYGFDLYLDTHWFLSFFD